MVIVLEREVVAVKRLHEVIIILQVTREVFIISNLIYAINACFWAFIDVLALHLLLALFYNHVHTYSV